jgi:methionyl-tRNA synthetase
MATKGKYYITTAIAYASGKPHIGNTYEIVLADAIARYKRQEGYDVFFQTGTDEHGQKNETKAKEAGVSPQEFVDGTSGEIKRIWDLMNTSYDKFMRTTEPYHVKQVQKIFKKLYDQGDIYKSSYKGNYCVSCESFWTDSQLVDGKCPDCGRPVQQSEEEAYFFKMSKYAPQLIDYINTHPEFIQPVSRKNEMMNNFLLPGLQDLCVSRASVKWGIPVDFDPKQTVYVWLDALTNYITGIGYDCDGNHSDLYKKYWPADLHLIGKDIVRFHTIYWPIFLMALGEPLPKQVFGHPWLLQKDSKNQDVKMSKSKGNVIYADDLVDLFGVDAVRYFVLHEMPYDNDGALSWDLLVERINSDLANTLGNLVKRTVSMENQYFGGVVSDKGVHSGGVEGDDGSFDDDLIAVAKGTKDKVEADMEKLRVADALTDIFALLKRSNKYIDETQPWVLAKDESKKDRLATVLYNLVESISIAATLLKAFLPDTSVAILNELNADEIPYDELGAFGHYPKDGSKKVTAEPKTLFERLKLQDVMEKVKVIEAKQKEAFKAAEKTQKDIENSASKPEISIDDFGKLDLRVGEIISCEAVEKSNKLLCSQVRIGSETKQIVSGIRKYYSPEEMVGKKVMVICNLKPAKLAGVLSEGMLLCAQNEDGNLALMTPEKDMPAGAKIS